MGDPSDLLLDFIDKSQPIHQGQILVTAGWSNGAISSAFPPGIPIGKVQRRRRVGEQQTYQRVHVTPFADMREPRLRAGRHRRAEARRGCPDDRHLADRASGSR